MKPLGFKALGKFEKELSARHLGEMGLIERILSGFSEPRRDRIIVGPGDDAAVIEFGETARVVVTIDTLVEGVHFRLDWSYPEALGFKSVAANLSDIAAMGGQAVGIVISLGIPPMVPVKAVDEVYRGISKALSLFGGDLLGGDTVRSSAISVSISAIGVLVGERPLLRSGARAGDKICMTGSVGRSELGLMLLKRYFELTHRPRKAALEAWAERTAGYFKKKLPSSLRKTGYACISKHLMPSPRIKEARVLSAFGPSAMIDISDGLSADLMQVARASGVGLVLREEDIPIDANARAVAQALGISPHKIALSSGEEYEILFTIPIAKMRQAARALARRCGTAVEVIGEITEDKESVLVIGTRGRKRTLVETGFRHF
jgi:thiamine-monophosphate kinase